jgi:hypothetical protein
MEIDQGILGILMTVSGLIMILIYVRILEKRHVKKTKALKDKMKNNEDK